MLKCLNDYNWKYNIAGFITNDDLKYIIENHYIIEKNQKIGKWHESYKGTKMDADNYYVQASSMRNSADFIERMKEYAKR